jgi:hypothetical protein
MRFTTIIRPAALAVALSIGAAPAFADMRDQNGREKSRATAGRAVQRQGRAAERGREYGPAARYRDDRYVARDYRYDQRRYIAPGYGYREAYRPRGWSGLIGSLGLGFNIGGVRVGIFAGRPLPYRYAYAVPAYRYRYPIRVVPGVRYGGVSFLISPTDASVYVDGSFVGTAREFYGNEVPLPLTPGVHRIELRAPGFAPMVFDVDAMPGQVIPYQGSLRPLY